MQPISDPAALGPRARYRLQLIAHAMDVIYHADHSALLDAPPCSVVIVDGEASEDPARDDTPITIYLGPLWTLASAMRDRVDPIVTRVRAEQVARRIDPQLTIIVVALYRGAATARLMPRTPQVET